MEVAAPSPQTVGRWRYALDRLAQNVLRMTSRKGPGRLEAKIEAIIVKIAALFAQMRHQPRDEDLVCALCLHVGAHLHALFELERAVDSKLGHLSMDDKERSFLHKRIAAVRFWADHKLRREWRFAQMRWREQFYQSKQKIEATTSHRLRRKWLSALEASVFECSLLSPTQKHLYHEQTAALRRKFIV